MIKRIVQTIIALYNYIVSTLVIPTILIPYVIYTYLFRNKNEKYWNKIIKGMLFIMNTKHIWVNKKYEFLTDGFILTNHRTWFDVGFDPYITNTYVIGRNRINFAMLLSGLYAYLEERLISIDRSDTRDIIFKKVIAFLSRPHIKNKSAVFYPEGKRLRHTQLNSIEDAKSTLRYGLLKSIYEYKILPVQVLITKNKELVFNESNCTANMNVTLYSSISKEINPSNYDTFDNFYHSVAEEWYKQWNIVYT